MFLHSILTVSLQCRQAALKRQDLSRMYLAHHELETDFVIIIIIITIIGIIICTDYYYYNNRF